jgi:hypothetical protein
MENIIEWAFAQAEALISPLGNRWKHVQGVARQAYHVAHILNEDDDKQYLIASAYLHDVGYAPSLQKTGFHPLDGACYLSLQGESRIVSLVAYHSESQFEADLRGLTPELSSFAREYSVVSDALTYCDMTTSSTGECVSFQERLDGILARYDDIDSVAQAIRRATPFLSLAVERTQQLLSQR